MADAQAPATLTRQRGWQAQLGEIRSGGQQPGQDDQDQGGENDLAEASIAAQEQAQARLLQAQEAARKRERIVQEQVVQQQAITAQQEASAQAEGAQEQADLEQMQQAAGQQFAKSAANKALDKLSERSQVIFGAMIKSMWSTLWMSFGHTVYIIDIFFAVGFVLNVIFGRRVVPEVGGEWVPPIPEPPGGLPGGAGQDLKTMRKNLVFMIKIGEFFALGIITSLVMLVDAAILFMIALIIEAARGVASIF